MRVEQHLVGLQKVGPNGEGPAIRQLGVRHLQLGAHTTQDRPILTPVELEGFTRLKGQRHEGAPPADLLLALPVYFPLADKGRQTTVRAVIS